MAVRTQSAFIFPSPAPPASTLGPAPPAPPQSEVPEPEVAVVPLVTLQQTPCPAVLLGPGTGQEVQYINHSEATHR